MKNARQKKGDLLYIRSNRRNKRQKMHTLTFDSFQKKNKVEKSLKVDYSLVLIVKECRRQKLIIKLTPSKSLAKCQTAGTKALVSRIWGRKSHTRKQDFGLHNEFFCQIVWWLRQLESTL